MKNTIYNILYFILIIGLPLVFTMNGLGVTTWQWWTLTLGMCVCYVLGMLTIYDRRI